MKATLIAGAITSPIWWYGRHLFWTPSRTVRTRCRAYLRGR